MELQVDVYRVDSREVFIGWSCSSTLVDYFYIYKRQGIVGIDRKVKRIDGKFWERYLSPQCLSVVDYFRIEAIQVIDSNEVVVGTSVVVSELSKKSGNLRLSFENFLGFYNAQPVYMQEERVIEIPVGDINGINQIYTTTYLFREGSILVNINGQEIGSHQYSINGREIRLLGYTLDNDEMISVEYVREKIYNV